MTAVARPSPAPRRRRAGLARASRRARRSPRRRSSLLFARDAADMARDLVDQLDLQPLPADPADHRLAGLAAPARAARSSRPRAWAPGLLLVGAGALAWLLGEAGGVAFARHLGLVLMLQGAVDRLPRQGGGARPRFPALLRLVPGAGRRGAGAGDADPDRARSRMALLALTGVPAHLEGIFITTPTGYFEVAEACAGVKFLIAMVAFGALVANVCFRSWPRRLAFIAAAIVVPILANGVRAWGTIYIAHLHRASSSPPASTMSSTAGIFFAIVIALILAAGWRFFDRGVDEPWFDPDGAPAPEPPRGRAARPWSPPPPSRSPRCRSLWSAAVAAAGDPRRVPPTSPARGARLAARAARRAAPWQPHFAGADRIAHRPLPRRARAGRSISPSPSSPARARAASWSASARARRRRTAHWAWTADAAAAAGRTRGTDRLARDGTRGGQLLPGRRRRDRKRGGVKLETMKVRLLGGPQRAVAVLVSADGELARPAIDDFLARARARSRRSPTAPPGSTEPMCGIAGIFHPDVPKPVDPARVEAMTRRARPSRPRRQRRLDRAGRRLRPPPAVDHRPRRAGAQPMLSRRRRASRSATTARSTISARCARSSRRKGHAFRTESDTEVILAAWRQWGPDCLAALQRHVRLRALRRRPRTPVPRPRPARREAALLCRAFRRRPDLRLGAEGPARPSRCCAAAPSRRRSRIISPSATSPTTPRSSRASRSSPPAIICCVRRGRPVPAAGAAGGTSISPIPSAARSQALEEELVERLRARGALADGRRRAARRLPLRRRRQLGGGRLHGRGEPRRGRDLLDRLRRGRP